MSYVKFWLESIFVVGFFYGVVLVNQGAAASSVVTAFYAALGALQAINAFTPMYLVLARGMSAGRALQDIIKDDGTNGRIKMTAEHHGPLNSIGSIVFQNVSAILHSAVLY